MDAIERLAAEQACIALSHRFARYVDERRFEDFAGLFTPDGVFDRRGEALAGRAAILASMAGRPATLLVRHHVTTVSVDVADADSASGLCYFAFYQCTDWDGRTPEKLALAGAAIVGEYRDRYARTAEGWRIAHRRALMTFMR